jgi:hypothetical protein
MLRVKDESAASEFGNLRVLTCTITGPPNLAGTTAAAEKLLAHPPQVRSGPLTATWMYQDSASAGRRFIDDRYGVREALSVGSIVVMSVGEAAEGADAVSVIYREESLAKPK